MSSAFHRARTHVAEHKLFFFYWILTAPQLPQPQHIRNKYQHKLATRSCCPPQPHTQSHPHPQRRRRRHPHLLWLRLLTSCLGWAGRQAAVATAAWAPSSLLVEFWAWSNAQRSNRSGKSFNVSFFDQPQLFVLCCVCLCVYVCICQCAIKG